MRPAESSSEQQIFLAGMEIANVSESNVQAHPRRELKPEFKKDVTRRWMERLVRLLVGFWLYRES